MSTHESAMLKAVDVLLAVTNEQLDSETLIEDERYFKVEDAPQIVEAVVQAFLKGAVH